ncbi:MAG: glycosyltransferase family 4 protein [Candidatus Omnitrophica bacterium]|nr:glycosyltransferase family 4 protein [Candidatus Omnitrophota bacterium]
MIKVGMDAQAAAGQLTGLGVFTKNLISAMTGEKNIPAVCVRDSFELHFYQDARYTVNTPKRLLWENAVLPGLLKKDRMDLVHVPAFAPAVLKKIKTVVTVHDLIGMLFPNQIGWVSRLYWGRWLPFAVQQSDAIIADSESTRRDLVKHLRVPENKISVVYPSGHESFSNTVPADEILKIREKFNLHQPYFIFVGTIEPRKNLARVIRALDRLCKKQPVKLVVVGSKDFGHGAFFNQLGRDAGEMFRDIIFTGYLEHEELNSLYCGAAALVYPSLYEGFGIPILEAMASGCPVITSNVSSTPEVAGDAALLVDPLSDYEIENAMKRVLEEPSLCERLREAAGHQIKKFSWDRTARETLTVYRKVLS